MSELPPRHELRNFERLNLLNFSFVTPPNLVKRADPQRIAEFDKPVFKERVAEVAYYALELSNPRLKRMELVNSRLQSMVPGTDEAMDIIDDVMIAEAVRSEIELSYEQYSLRPGSIDLERTKEYTPTNTGWLKALQGVHIASDHRARVGYETGRVSEIVARITIARHQGIQIDLSDESNAGVE